jgi:hypothetical protein
LKTDKLANIWQVFYFSIEKSKNLCYIKNMKSKNFIYMSEPFSSREQLVQDFIFNELRPCQEEMKIIVREETYYDTDNKDFLNSGGFFRYVKITTEDYSLKFFYEYKKNKDEKTIKIPFVNGSPNLKYMEKLTGLNSPLLKKIYLTSHNYIYPIKSYYGDEFSENFKLIIDEVHIKSMNNILRDDNLRFVIFKDYTSPYKQSRSSKTVERIMLLEQGYKNVDDNRYKIITEKIQKGFKPKHYR